MKKKIALLAGGYSGESVISVQSAKTIRENLDPEKYEVYTILIYPEGWWYEEGSMEAPTSFAVDKNDFSLHLPGNEIHFDAAFIAIHGTPGEDGKLQGYLEMIGIPFTSCGAITSALTFNKSFCNKVVRGLAGVKVSQSIHLFKDQPFELNDILRQVKLPFFVKPNEGGSSIGISKVDTEDQLPVALAKAFGEGQQVLIEEMVKGREITCGLFQSGGKVISLPLTEIISSKDFFDFEAKYTPGKSIEVTPAGISPELAERIREVSIRIFHHLNCRGIVRIDYIVQENTEDIYFLEINTMPGQSEQSIVPQQVKKSGINLRDFYGTILAEVIS
ncbi:MAG: D-alanine--D-alanine ligase [Chitinophagaceae bacterium]